MNGQDLIIDAEFKALIKPLEGDEYQLLEQSLLADGCRDALAVWQGVLIDGHNRLEICRKHGLEFSTREIALDGREAAKEWIARNQLGRRNLLTYEKARLARMMEEAIAARAKENLRTRARVLPSPTLVKTDEPTDSLEGEQSQPSTNWSKAKKPIDTREEVAKIAGVGQGTIERVKVVDTRAPESVRHAMEKGEISINRAFETTKALETLPESLQAIMTAEFEKSEKPATVAERIIDLARKPAPAPVTEERVRAASEAVAAQPPMPRETKAEIVERLKEESAEGGTVDATGLFRSVRAKPVNALKENSIYLDIAQALDKIHDLLYDAPIGEYARIYAKQHIGGEDDEIHAQWIRETVSALAAFLEAYTNYQPGRIYEYANE